MPHEPIVREQGVASSNLAAPTNIYKWLVRARKRRAQEMPRKRQEAMFPPVAGRGAAARWSAAVSAVAVLAWLGLVAALMPRPITAIDGDTVDRWPWRYRLIGFDAPEIRRARCPAVRR